jgi:eukaryotic-like serine/threonine-protein kinase
MTEEALFELTLNTPSCDRAALLDRECADDPDLRSRVEALLVMRQVLESLGRQEPAPTSTTPPGDAPPTAPGETTAPPDGRPADGVGSLVAGRYLIVEELGEGGMGTVFLAQQRTPVRRTVALKVIKAGMDTRAVLVRFEAERQALALMDHPHIARVFDAGTTDSGRPFFVMELVKGVPITLFCDERKLTPRQRLELFVPVCQAIQHAHQKGVIHRDIKPSNVLVATYDDRPVPKVIDFGVAKATGAQLTERTLLTGFGTVVGTPEYMSPEQATLNNLDIDTRSDVYSLGVLLYELLTGTTPVDRRRLGQVAVLEILRIVREVEPPAPSSRLSGLEALTSIAANRSTEPARLAGLLRGELDWVVLKALEKDRARRYETINALARDIQRYLHGDPVDAGPPSATYRLRKFAARYRAAIVAAGAFAGLLMLGVVVSTLLMIRAMRAEGEAVRAREKADKNLNLARNETERANMEAKRSRREADRARALLLISQARENMVRRPQLAPILAVEAARILQRDDTNVPRVFPCEEFLNEVVRMSTSFRLNEFDARDRILLQIRASPDGRWLVSHIFETDAEGGMVHLYDLSSPNLKDSRRTLLGHRGPSVYMTFRPDSRLLATVDGDLIIRLWDLTAPDPNDSPRTLGERRPGGSSSPGERETLIAFSPDGKWLVSVVDSAPRVDLWDLTTPGRNPNPLVLRGHNGRVFGCAFPDGSLLATASRDGTVRLWDLSLPDPNVSPRILAGHEGRNQLTAFSPDGKSLAWLGRDGMVRLWDLTARDPRVGPRTLGRHSRWIRTFAFHPSSRLLATLDSDRIIRLWDLTAPDANVGPRILGGHHLEQSRHEERDVAFSPDGKLLILTVGPLIQFWDLTGDDPNANSRLLNFSSEEIDSELSARNGRDMVSINPSIKPVDVPIVFSSDGKRIIFVRRNGTVRIWLTDLDDLLRLVRQDAVRNSSWAEWREYFANEPYRRTFPDLPDGKGVAEALRAGLR